MDFYWESCKMNKPISFVSHWIWHDLLRLQQKTNINIYVYDIYWFFFQYFPSENHCYADVARCYLSLSTYPAEAILHNLRASPQFRSVSQALFPRLSGKHTPSLQEPGVWLEKVWVPGAGGCFRGTNQYPPLGQQRHASLNLDLCAPERSQDASWCAGHIHSPWMQCLRRLLWIKS